MKYFSIPEPCSENWNEMTATEKGAFCQKCSNEVHDVSHMSNEEIVDLIGSEKKIPCMRMRPSQEKSLNLHLGMQFRSQKVNMQRAMLFSLLVVFGFTLFSCNDSQQIHDRNVLVSAAESLSRSLEQPSDMDKTTIDLAQQTDSITPVKTEKVNPSECIIEEPELLMLGEPVVYEEHVKGQAQIVEHEPRVITHTMGIPAMRIETTEPTELILSTEESSKENANIPKDLNALTFPNPTTTSTRLEVSLPNQTENLGIRLLDMNGRVLQTINDSKAKAGKHEFQIDVSNLKPAYYLIDVRYNDQHKIVRLSKVQ